MEVLLEYVAILMAGLIKYLQSQGVEITPDELAKRASSYLELDDKTLKSIAERHLARFNDQAVDSEDPGAG